ncbi:MAG: DUF3526 domain-containing protein [Rhodospirillaceae bacterium]|nr:DUF3526 domain-containing protein [Rhodospirillaceae bacterium]
MIWHVARKEFTEITRDGRFLWTSVIIFVLLLTSIGVGAARYGEDRALREAATAEVRDQWLTQGSKGPHSAGHYGVYAFKPATPLALFDPGLNDYTGVIQYLEAHKENQASFKPAQDATALQRFGDLSGAMIMQLLIPLLIILLCFGMISSEREEGTLRQLLSVGAKKTDLVWGKALGVGTTLAVILVPSALLGGILAASLVGENDPHDMIDFPKKVALLAAAYLVYFTIFTVISLAVSIVAKSSRAALTTLLSFWIVAGLLLPRGAADISRHLYKTPSALELATNIQIGRDKGPHPHETNHPNHIAFREKLLKEYNVSRIEDLPYSFQGLALQADEENGYRVFDKYYGAVRDAYVAQNRFQQFVGLVSPFIAIRSLSAALAGTDVDFSNEFSAAGESYRRSMVKLLNEDIMVKTQGKSQHDAEFGYKSDRSLWEKVPAFDFDAPPLGSIISRNILPIAVLLIWLVGGVGGLIFAARRMRVEA